MVTKRNRKTGPQRAAKQQTASNLVALKKELDQYRQVFGKIDDFVNLIHQQETEILDAAAAYNEAKAKYEQAKQDLADAREARDGSKHSLFKFLQPGAMKILPLFDRMDPADEEKHGAHADEWRQEPISAMRLSLVATNLLTAADVMFVGQLQDRVQDDPDAWWEKIDGLTAPVAMAIADQLNEFINDRTAE